MAKIILGIAAELAGGKGTATKYIVEKYDGTGVLPFSPQAQARHGLRTKN